MRTEQTLPPVLQNGFRPFFLLGAIWAVLAIVLWLAMLSGILTLPTAMEPVAWHRHEMLFGYFAAIVAAFLLTAVPSWTGRPPVWGGLLAGLVLLWLAGRAVVLASAVVGAWPALLVDVAFPVAFAALTAREVIAAKAWRNLPVIGLVGLLAVASLLSHLGGQGLLPASMLGDRLAIALGAGLVALIGGRIVPTFTTNWLRARGVTPLPAAFDHLDRGALALIGVALIAWLRFPQGMFSGLLLLLAAAGTALRLARWRGLATTAEPLLSILHVGYAWLALGLAALGLATLGLILGSAALHALAAGTFGTMTLAVMTRATLGHTGRMLTADGWTVAIYALVNLGALARLAAVWFPDMTMLHATGVLWGGAFLLYALRYGPMLLGPPYRPSSLGEPAGLRST